MCLYTQVCGGRACAPQLTMNMQKSKNNLWNLVLSFYFVGLWLILRSLGFLISAWSQWINSTVHPLTVFFGMESLTEPVVHYFSYNGGQQVQWILITWETSPAHHVCMCVCVLYACVCVCSGILTCACVILIRNKRSLIVTEVVISNIFSLVKLHLK